MSQHLIELNGVSKIYQMGAESLHALDNVTLSITRGETVAILGPSGSGKSTMMNILGCLDSPSSGKYQLDGRDVSTLSTNELAKIRNKKIGFVFQSFNLLDYSNTLDNVCLPLIYRGVSAKERKKAGIEVLSRLGLSDRLKHRPSELSGGQRQRVAVARALVTNPDVLLADEPTGNLDSESGEAVIKLFEALSDQGKTVIIVTHDLSLAKRMSRIVEIKDGHIIRS